MNNINYNKIKNYNNDIKIENKINKFLDDNFYSQLSSKIEFKRETALSSQYAGIDLYLGSSIIDEKSKNTSCPNSIKDYYASLEIYHTTKDGRYTKGWFINPDIKTTHYYFEYRFEDMNQEISSVIIVSFNKQSMTDYLDKSVGIEYIINEAAKMENAQKYIDDKPIFNKQGKKIGKLTKSYEGATVLTFKLMDLQNVSKSTILEVQRGKKLNKLSFAELSSRFTN